MTDRHLSERRRHPIVLKAMSSPFSLPLIGGSLLAAVVVGIHLGESSIGLIKPIYFQGPAPHPRDRGAAIEDSTTLTPARTTYASLYGWEDGNAARAATCNDCDAPAPPSPKAYSAVVPYFGERGTATVPPHEDRAADGVGARKPHDFEVGSDIVRYAHYPITEEEVALDRFDRRAADALEPREDADPGYDRRRASYQERDVWIEPARAQRWER